MKEGKMIRVGMRAGRDADELVLMLVGPRWGKLGIPLTLEEAADLHVQIRELLPTDLLNVEPGSSDELPPDGVPA